MESSLKTIKKLSIADTYLSIAQLELTMGLFNDCMTDVKKAQEIYLKEDREGIGMIEANLLLSKLNLAKNNTQAAEMFINTSVKLAKKLDYKIFRQLQVQGDILMQIGQPEDAILIKQDALDEAMAVNIIPQIIWSHIRLGDAYEVIGDTKKAKEHFKKANSLQKSIGQGTSSLNPSLKLRLGDVKNAYDLFNQSGALLGANIAALKLAETMLSSGESDSLEINILSAHQYFTNEGVVEGQAKAELLLSILYQAQDKYDEAWSRLEQAEVLGVNAETQWKIWYNKGLISQAKGEYAAAEKWYEQSIDTFEKLRNELTRSDFKWHYLDSKVDVYDSYLTMILKYKNVDEEIIRRAFNLNERARSRTFLEMLGNRSFVQGQEGSLVELEKTITNEITYLNNQLNFNKLKGMNTEYFEVRIEDLEKNWAMIIKEMEQTKNKYAALISIDPVSLNDLMKTLDPQTALLEFWVGKNSLVTWKIDDSNVTYKILDIDKREVSKVITKARNLIRFGNEELIIDSFTELYDVLSPAFQDIFDTHQHVGIIPHGPLHFIPFEAFYGEDKFLVEKTDMFYSPSASIFYYAKNRARTSGGRNLLGMALGNLKLGELNALPGTAIELEQLAQFYAENECVYADNISESYFKEEAKNFNLIHIATHGVMNEYNPSKSYVLMAPSEKDDGQLRVEEIFDLELNADFVTLSACETGSGDLSEGDELIGLSRAFIYAGTSAVIVSLWKVDDISTSMLMTKMHQLIDAGMSLSAALSQAQRDMINSNFSPQGSRGMQSIEWHSNMNDVVNSKESKFASPYFWAPFVIIGSPNLN